MAAQRRWPLEGTVKVWLHACVLSGVKRALLKAESLPEGDRGDKKLECSRMMWREDSSPECPGARSAGFCQKLGPRVASASWFWNSPPSSPGSQKPWRVQNAHHGVNKKLMGP